MVSNVLGDSMAKDVLALVKESLPIIRPCGSPEKTYPVRPEPTLRDRLAIYNRATHDARHNSFRGCFSVRRSLNNYMGRRLVLLGRKRRIWGLF